MTPFEVATLATSVAIGLGQIAIVWYGIRAMTRSSNVRADETARLAKQQDQRHAEAMTALKELIDGQRDDRRALLELIARTGQAQPAS